MTNAIFKKISNISYYVILIFIVVIAGLLILSQSPFNKNYRIFIVKSGSMAPTIKTGSLIIVKHQNEYHKGEIITFGKISKNSTPTTHRIVEIKKYPNKITYITKGDANKTADWREVTKNEVIGKVILTIPYLGFLLAAVKKPLGFLFIIIIPALIIIYDEIKNIKQEIKKMKK